jgi:HSP20 family protein
MTLVTRDPFLAEPFRLMDDMFGRMLGSRTVTGFVPALDVHETDEEYVVVVDLPGVKPDDVSIDLDDRILTISGTRVPLQTGDAKSVERPYGSFVRKLTLPKGVETDAITADYADGVLWLHVPKAPEARPKRIAIGGGHKALAEGAS